MLTLQGADCLHLSMHWLIFSNKNPRVRVNKALVWRLKAHIRNHGYVQNSDSHKFLHSYVYIPLKWIDLVSLCNSPSHHFLKVMRLHKNLSATALNTTLQQ